MIRTPGSAGQGPVSAAGSRSRSAIASMAPHQFSSQLLFVIIIRRLSISLLRGQSAAVARVIS